MKMAMVSQPMGGFTKKEILEARERATKRLKDQGYVVADTYFDDDFSDEDLKEYGIVQLPVFYLAKSLEAMSFCDVVYFCKGWGKARGCRIEHEVAVAYGLDVIYEEEEWVII